MNCFQIIKSILDEEYDRIPGNEVEKDKKIKAQLQALSDSYTQLLEESTISYRDPITRFAYIYRYVTSHANLVCTLIENNENLQSIFDNEKVRAVIVRSNLSNSYLFDLAHTEGLLMC